MIGIGHGSEWFYSTLAQTCAAIVGLVGAILGGHIIDHVSLMREERREILQKINSTYQHFQERIAHWRLFRKYLIERIERENSVFDLGSPALDPTPILTWDSGKTLQHIHPGAHLGERFEPEHDLEFLELLTPAYELLEGEVDEREMEQYVDNLRAVAKKLPSESKPAHIALVDAAGLKKLTNRVARFRAKLFPRSFAIILVVLGWLSMTGIIWPLAALPGFHEGPTQYIMLITLAIGILALIGYYAYQLQELTRIGRMYWEKPH